MIKSVIAKIDCGDEYCDNCNLYRNRVSLNNSCEDKIEFVCNVFDQVLVVNSDTLKRCDACKQAELKTEVTIDTSDKNDEILKKVAIVPPKERSKFTGKNLGVKDFESCPHCRGSFSFRKPGKDGICPWCNTYILKDYNVPS